MRGSYFPTKTCTQGQVAVIIIQIHSQLGVYTISNVQWNYFDGISGKFTSDKACQILLALFGLVCSPQIDARSV